MLHKQSKKLDPIVRSFVLKKRRTYLDTTKQSKDSKVFVEDRREKHAGKRKLRN